MKLSPLVGCSWLANLSVKVNGDLDGTVVTQLTLTTDEMGAQLVVGHVLYPPYMNM